MPAASCYIRLAKAPSRRFVSALLILGFYLPYILKDAIVLVRCHPRHSADDSWGRLPGYGFLQSIDYIRNTKLQQKYRGFENITDKWPPKPAH